MSVLTDPRWTVPPLPDAGGGPLDRLRRSVPRFATGAEHAARRAEVERLLATLPPATLRAATCELVRKELAGKAGEAATPRRAATPAGADRADAADRAGAVVPVRVLAGALGAADPVGVAELVAVVAAAYFPGPPPPGADAVAAADAAVTALLGRHGLDPVRLGLLIQACVPVATLVRAALARGGLDAVVDPPVPATRRWRPDTGQTVTVPLAGTPFGAGPRRCPARDHALALAAGVLDGVAR